MSGDRSFVSSVAICSQVRTIILSKAFPNCLGNIRCISCIRVYVLQQNTERLHPIPNLTRTDLFEKESPGRSDIIY